MHGAQAARSPQEPPRIAALPGGIAPPSPADRRPRRCAAPPSQSPGTARSAPMVISHGPSIVARAPEGRVGSVGDAGREVVTQRERLQRGHGHALRPGHSAAHTHRTARQADPPVRQPPPHRRPWRAPLGRHRAPRAATTAARARRARQPSSRRPRRSPRAGWSCRPLTPPSPSGPSHPDRRKRY